MAAVATVHDSWDLGGNLTGYIGTIALDSSYPTGGEAIDLGGNENIQYLSAQPDGTAAGGAGYKPEFNRATQSLLMFQGDNTNAAAAPAIQVPNATNLAGITALPFFAIGQ